MVSVPDRNQSYYTQQLKEFNRSTTFACNFYDFIMTRNSMNSVQNIPLETYPPAFFSCDEQQTKQTADGNEPCHDEEALFFRRDSRCANSYCNTPTYTFLIILFCFHVFYFSQITLVSLSSRRVASIPWCQLNYFDLWNWYNKKKSNSLAPVQQLIVLPIRLTFNKYIIEKTRWKIPLISPKSFLNPNPTQSSATDWNGPRLSEAPGVAFERRRDHSG